VWRGGKLAMYMEELQAKVAHGPVEPSRLDEV
jgi:hypothetical protein